MAEQLSQQPKFLNGTIIPKYISKQSAVFHMHGPGVFDLGTPGVLLKDYLSITLSPKFPLQVFYEPARGFSFPKDDEPNDPDGSKQSFESWYKATTGYDPATLYKANTENALAILVKWVTTDESDADGNPTGTRRLAILPRMDLCYSSVHGREPSQTTINLIHDHCGHPILETQNMMLMFSEALESVHSSLRDSSNGITHIEVDLPDEEERYAYIHDRVRMQDGVIEDEPIVRLEMSERQLAEATSGISRLGIEDIILEGCYSTGHTVNGKFVSGTVTRDMAVKMSAEAIKTEAAGLLTVFDPKYGRAMLGGLEHVKRFSDERLIGPAHSDDPEMKQIMPYVMVLLGPPGTGKTEIAQVLGYDLGWNVLAWAQIKDSLLGESEKNNAKANRIIKKKYPEVLIWDEADQDGGTRGDGPNSHSVDQALFRSRLLLLNDTSLRGRVLIVVIANWGDQLDPAILDRADEVIPILPATTCESRAEILSKLFAREAGITVTADALTPAAALLDNRWSNRDMKGLVIKAASLMKLRSLTVIDAAVQAAKTRRPSQGPEVEAMIDIALKLTKDEELIPDEYRERAARVRRPKAEQPQPKRGSKDRSHGGIREL